EISIKSKVNLSRIYTSPHTLELILTYHINYELSTLKTAALMHDIHQLKITHQTVLNNANSVALLTKPFIDNYPYELSNSFCGDETYIRVKGKRHYFFFFFVTIMSIFFFYQASTYIDLQSS